MRLLSNDFGPNHGFTLFEYKSDTDYTLTSWQKHLGENGHRRLWLDYVALLGRHPETVFIGERFLFLHEFRDRDKIDLTAPEYIGVAHLYCQAKGIESVWQNASQACGQTAFWGDSKEGNDKIKKLGLWEPNQRHAMDSLRHMLYHVSFTLNMNLFLKGLK